MNRDANYRGVYENRIGFGKHPALPLVDFVQAYFELTCDLYAAVEDALASAVRVRDEARAARMPVICTNVVYQKHARRRGSVRRGGTRAPISFARPAGRSIFGTGASKNDEAPRATYQHKEKAAGWRPTRAATMSAWPWFPQSCDQVQSLEQI